MKIPINKDIDSYKEDLWKGLSLKQIVFSVITIVVGAGVGCICYFKFHMPLEICGYIMLPIAFPFALLGFFEMNRMSLGEYVSSMWKLTFQEPFTYRSEELVKMQPTEKHKSEVLCRDFIGKFCSIMKKGTDNEKRKEVPYES